MKKSNILIYSVLIILLSIVLSGCGINNVQTKTEFHIGEQANIDDYLVTCENYEEKDGILKVNFKLTNNNKQEKAISLQNNFEIYSTEDQDIKVKNISSKEIINVDANESIDVPLEFDISNIQFDVSNYKILFYSGVATNNIAFILSS